MRSRRGWWRWTIGAASLLAGAAVLGLPSEPEPEWLEIDYRPFVDLDRISHSGETVGELLDRLGGRPRPAGSERPEDRAAHALLDPLLEPYAFVLSDVVDALVEPPQLPWVEVGALWSPGEPQPAWAELLRSRRFLVESDGAGRLRAFLPFRESEPIAGEPPVGSEAAARAAWEDAWPVLRLVAAAERRRLGGDRPLAVEVYAYTHEPARTRFHVGVRPFRTEISETAPDGRRPPLDLDRIQRFLDSGWQLEGGRVEPDGTLRLFGSRPKRPPALLGHPVTLADVAVAYRAVFHGGAAEPYMSLDRGDRAERMTVNYGGRLRDTRLGLVSLLCDVRFKTFSVGLDPLRGGDVRERLRARVPDFATHVERFARLAGPEAAGGQQTRLWFYPDDVEMALSARGDLMALARARMTAASERAGGGAGEDVPAWTRGLVEQINAQYDALAEEFPELAGLDQAVRWLALFTWLRQLDRQGALLPELDALLAVPLPSVPTPRSFPQVVAVHAIPPAGREGPVDVFDRSPVVDALARLAPREGERLSPRRRFARALAALDRNHPQQAALAREMEAIDPRRASTADLLRLARRAERLRLHALALRSLPEAGRRRLEERRKTEGPELRVFDVAIGGLDLGMGRALAGAARRSLRWGSSGVAALAAPEAVGAGPAPRPEAPREEWRRDPEGLPDAVLPDHGLGQAPEHAAAGGSFKRRYRETASGWFQRLEEETSGTVWLQVVTDPDGPEARSRLVELGPDGRAVRFERTEEGRQLAYRLARDGSRVVARRAGRARLLPFLRLRPGSHAGPTRATLQPADLVTLSLESPGEAADPERAPVTVSFRLSDGRAFTAPVPRPLLQRLVMGPEAVPAPEKGVPGLAPLPEMAGRPRAVMVLEGAGRGLPPWAVAPAPAVPGEEEAERVALGFASWRDRTSGPAAVVGVDVARSPGRWGGAPAVNGDALLLAPRGAFPGLAEGWRERIAANWPADRLVEALPEDAASVPSLVLLVSGEPPGLLGRRLRSLARDERMSGKILAVWSLAAGPLRPDLPATLLAEGRLAAVGLRHWPAARLSRLEAVLAARAAAVRASAGKGLRAEEIFAGTLWFY
ncbi:MAG: hypothetical protein D6718_05505 [Acidobacteria bacterium]|nr:MAG: hypothetical protein D6718_05505 [Acidobacteriota bacterium]